MGRAPINWRIVTTESHTPVAPAASLLFQAPVFQAAPEVAAPVVVDEPEAKPKRRRRRCGIERPPGRGCPQASPPLEESRRRRARGQRSRCRNRRGARGVEDAPSPPLEEGRRGLGPRRGECRQCREQLRRGGGVGRGGLLEPSSSPSPRPLLQLVCRGEHRSCGSGAGPEGVDTTRSEEDASPRGASRGSPPPLDLRVRVPGSPRVRRTHDGHPRPGWPRSDRDP